MIKLRAHHLLCIPRYYSGGYNKKFAKQHKKICLRIRKNPDLKIKIIKKVDDLCKVCPHRKGSICMKTPIENREVLLSDKRVLRKLKLKKNSIHKAKDIFNLSMKRIPNVKNMCLTCDMLESCVKLGINDSFRKELNKK